MENKMRLEKLKVAMEKANAKYGEAKHALGHWLELVRDCGKELCHAKKLFKKTRATKTTWREYVRKEFAGRSLETAQDYMIVFKKWDDPLLQKARKDGIEINSIRAFMRLLVVQIPEPEDESHIDQTKETESEIDNIAKDRVEKTRSVLLTTYKHEIIGLDDKHVLLVNYGLGSQTLLLWTKGYEWYQNKVRKRFKQHGFQYDPWDNKLSIEELERDINIITTQNENKSKEVA